MNDGSRKVPAQPNGREMTPAELADDVVAIVKKIANLHGMVTTCVNGRLCHSASCSVSGCLFYIAGGAKSAGAVFIFH